MPVLHGQVGLKKILLAMTELRRGFGLTSFKVQSSKSTVHSPRSKVQSPRSKVRSPKSAVQSPQSGQDAIPFEDAFSNHSRLFAFMRG